MEVLILLKYDVLEGGCVAKSCFPVPPEGSAAPIPQFTALGHADD